MSRRPSLPTGIVLTLGLSVAGAFVPGPTFAQSMTEVPTIYTTLVHDGSVDGKGGANRPQLHLRDTPPALAAPAGAFDAKRAKPGFVVRIGPAHAVSSTIIPDVKTIPVKSVAPSVH